MNKLKILFTMTPPFNPNDGGVQRTTFKLGKKFTELGHSIFYFSLSNEGNLNSEFGKLYHASQPERADNMTNLSELIEVLNKTRPDFVINQMPYEKELTKCLYNEKKVVGYILLGCLRNSLFSVKNNIRDTSKRVLPNYIFKIFDNPAGLYLLLQLHRKKHKKQLKRILDFHDEFILLAPPNKDELNYFVGDYKKEKVKVVPNSIPEIYNEPPKKEKILLHVGRLNIQQKRSDLLFKFWEKTYDHLKEWKFIIVGDGPYLKNIQKAIKDKNIPRMQLLGYQQPEEWYKKASIFIMTSAYEGFPNVILESQSYACVPIAFKSYDAISWIVNDKKDALLCEPFNIEEMAKEVIELVTGDKLEKMAVECKNNASKFVINTVAKKWIRLFDKLKRGDK